MFEHCELHFGILANIEQPDEAIRARTQQFLHRNIRYVNSHLQFPNRLLLFPAVHPTSSPLGQRSIDSPRFYITFNTTTKQQVLAFIVRIYPSG